jgi:hypothetical protein
MDITRDAPPEDVEMREVSGNERSEDSDSSSSDEEGGDKQYKPSQVVSTPSTPITITRSQRKRPGTYHK